jgi:hypothetical protein
MPQGHHIPVSQFLPSFKTGFTMRLSSDDAKDENFHFKTTNLREPTEADYHTTNRWMMGAESKQLRPKQVKTDPPKHISKELSNKSTLCFQQLKDFFCIFLHFLHKNT